MATYEGLKRMMREHQEEEESTHPPTHLTQPPPLYQRILAGALAGVAGWLVIYPLDVRTHTYILPSTHPPIYTNPSTHPPTHPPTSQQVVKSRLQADALAPGKNKYSTMSDCFRQSYQKGGMRSLYSGLGFTLLRAVPVASVILPSYDATYWFLSKYVEEE